MSVELWLHLLVSSRIFKKIESHKFYVQTLILISTKEGLNEQESSIVLGNKKNSGPSCTKHR